MTMMMTITMITMTTTEVQRTRNGGTTQGKGAQDVSQALGMFFLLCSFLLFYYTNNFYSIDVLLPPPLP